MSQRWRAPDRLTGLEQRSRRIHLRSGGFVCAVAQFIQRFALHMSRRRDAEIGEDRRCEVEDTSALQNLSCRDLRS